MRRKHLILTSLILSAVSLSINVACLMRLNKAQSNLGEHVYNEGVSQPTGAAYQVRAGACYVTNDLDPGVIEVPCLKPQAVQYQNEVVEPVMTASVE